MLERGDFQQMLCLMQRRIPRVTTLQSRLGSDLFAAWCAWCLAPAASSAALRCAAATSRSSPAAGPAAASNASSAADGAAAAPPAPQRLLRMSASKCACASQKLWVDRVSAAGVQHDGRSQGRSSMRFQWLGGEAAQGSQEQKCGHCTALCIDLSAQ